MNILNITDLVVEYPGRATRAKRDGNIAKTALLRVPSRIDEIAETSATVRALDGVSLELAASERVALVGESGSGKSTLGNSIGRLLPTTARFTRGSIKVGQVDVLGLGRAALRNLRRGELGFIPQDPIASLDPTMRVGRQFSLIARAVDGPTDRRSLERMLEAVQINDPARVLRAFPHELSGGMAQRVAIAIAIIRKPKILIADEPTAALDANVRREVLKLIFDVAAEHGTAILWISHDLGAIAQHCDRVAVMNRGQIVEVAEASRVLTSPQHEYTRHLLDSMPARLIEDREGTK